MAVISKVFVALLSVAGSLASPIVARDVDFNSTLLERGDSDFIIAAPRSELHPEAIAKRQSSPNYSQDYIASGANVQFTPNGNSFSVTYNTNQDFVVGRGWTTGDTTPINFSGSFSVTSGTGLLSVYGWTTNPLIEYYIMEDASNPPQQGTIKGTFTSDGGTYTVWEHQQVNQPSISGTTTFNQYLSIRNSGRSSGTVTLENHFKQWASYGMNLGSFNYQTISVESWSGAGKASQTVTKGGSGSTSTGSGTGTGTGTTTGSGSGTGTGSGTTGSTGSCAAQYGQCGGTGWTGSTCCSAGSCKAANSYYSQCL